MPDDPMIQELQLKLNEAQWLMDEDREVLEGIIVKFRELCAIMAPKQHLDPLDAAARKKEMRTLWLEYLQKCRDEDEAIDDSLQAKGKVAEARSALVMQLLRNARSIRKVVEADNYTGTWEQRENLLDIAKDVEARKAQFLSELSADQIQQLKDEGVI